VVPGDHNLVPVKARKVGRQRSVSIRVSKLWIANLQDLVAVTGTPFAQLCRELILIGAVLTFTRFQDPKEFEYLADAVGLSRRFETIGKDNPFKGTLGKLVSVQIAVARDGRARNARSLGGTQVVRIRLPGGFLRLVDLYRKLVRATRSAVLVHFLMNGYVLYLGSRIVIMKALWQATGGSKLRSNPPSSKIQ